MNRQTLVRVAIIGVVLIGMALVSAPLLNSYLSLNRSPGADTPEEANLLPLIGASANDESVVPAPAITLQRPTGKVMLQQPGSDEFSLYDPADLALQPGSTLRTLSDGLVTIKIGEDSEIALGPNSQIEILEYENLGEQKTIKVRQLVGDVIYRVNFAEGSNSTFVAETPWGEVGVVGTTFRIAIILEEFTLPNGEIDWEALIAANPSDEDVLVSLDVNTGQVVFSYVEPTTGNTQLILIDPNETLTLDSALGLLEVGPSTAGCGDEICDPYEDEDADTCPADCTGG